MFLRTIEINRNGRSYRYTHLLESYRRPSDGRPAHRLVANLGELSDTEIDNFKTALHASRLGTKVTVASAPVLQPVAKPAANLRYLDLAVLLELWRDWQLDSLLKQVLAASDTLAPAESVVACLVLQRCVDPGSKLYAERWFPRTALPELLGVPCTKFNNTRLHRVLDQLDRAGGDLMAKLSRRVHERQGQFGCLFLDTTDTWFEGHGPELADNAKTKEGMVRRKVGIALLCDAQGYPLRWQVLRGCQADCEAMSEVVDAVCGLSWTRQTPLVMDRAMGHSAQLHHLVRSGVHFLTALTATEMHSYCPQLPGAALDSLVPHSATDTEAMAQAAATVKAAGMTAISNTIHVMDLGLTGSTSGESDGFEPPLESQPIDEDNTAHAVRIGRAIHDDVMQGRAASLAAAARTRGISNPQARKYHRLVLGLVPDVQFDILEGRATGVSLGALTKLLAYPDPDEQYARFKALPKRKPRPAPSRQTSARPQHELPTVRLVANFNPSMFVEQRYKALATDARLQRFVADRNARAHRRNLQLHVQQELRRCAVADLYDVHADGDNHCQLVRNELLWSKKRRLDGFSVLVCHPELTLSPEQLVRTYRAKDAIEKDFEIIKSLVKIRPVRHRTNAKVRAHVTLCMLALLLQRTLAVRLDKLSAKRAIEQLSTCCLNLYQQADTPSLYTITAPDDDQRAILHQLGLARLVDDKEAADRLTPR